MPRRRSTSRDAFAACVALATLFAPAVARAQACCAGSGALTPGRLAVYEDALAGVRVRGAGVLGSWDSGGRYVRSPSGATEIDLEESVFGALRVLSRGQVALLVPFPETYRKARGRSETGGGIGDVNASARYDFHLAGQSRYVPGVALLAGVTAPTGTPIDKVDKSTDATGVGAWQLNGGVALEQLYGNFLFNLTGIVAKRTSRAVQGVDETLGTRFTGLAGAAYTLGSGAAVSLLASYAAESRATIDGVVTDGTAKHLLELSIGGMVPITDHWRVQGSLFLDPPLDHAGENELASTGASATLVRSWW